MYDEPSTTLFVLDCIVLNAQCNAFTHHKAVLAPKRLTPWRTWSTDINRSFSMLSMNLIPYMTGNDKTYPIGFIIECLVLNYG